MGERLAQRAHARLLLLVALGHTDLPSCQERLQLEILCQVYGTLQLVLERALTHHAETSFGCRIGRRVGLRVVRRRRVMHRRRGPPHPLRGAGRRGRLWLLERLIASPAQPEGVQGSVQVFLEDDEQPDGDKAAEQQSHEGTRVRLSIDGAAVDRVMQHGGRRRCRGCSLVAALNRIAIEPLGPEGREASAGHEGYSAANH